MRRADRLFDIIQALRSRKSPLTAAALARRLEVTPRTIYRDVATLQARRIPIEGAAGVGYVLREGFDLPPLMFTTDEVEAIAIGTRMVRRLRDRKLQEAADGVLSKLASALPDALREMLTAPRFEVSQGNTPQNRGLDLADVRGAIRDGRKLRLTYKDPSGRNSRRTVLPVALIYYVDATVLAAWCELRGDFRHFRVDRVVQSRLLEMAPARDIVRLRTQWEARQRAA